MNKSYAEARHIALMTGQFVTMLSEATGLPTIEAQQQLLLLVLYEKGEVDQRQLVEFTNVGTTSNNRNIGRLGAGHRPNAKPDGTPQPIGWVESYRDPQDQRYTKVRLTALGRAEMDRICLTVARALKLFPNGQHSSVS